MGLIYFMFSKFFSFSLVFELKKISIINDTNKTESDDSSSCSDKTEI